MATWSTLAVLQRFPPVAIPEAIMPSLPAFGPPPAAFHCHDAFGGRVMVKAEWSEPEALLAALHAGHCYATQGTEILDISVSEAAIEAHSSPASSIMALGIGAKAEQVAGQGLTRARLPAQKVPRRLCPNCRCRCCRQAGLEPAALALNESPGNGKPMPSPSASFRARQATGG
jgi:hypothetical protein